MLALVAGGAGPVSIGAGAVLGRESGQFQTTPSQLGYGVGSWTVAVALGLWPTASAVGRATKRCRPTAC